MVDQAVAFGGAAGRPPEPTATSPRGADGVLQAGQVSVIGMNGIWGGSFWVAKHGNFKHPVLFPLSADGWAMAWSMFAGAEPDAAGTYWATLRRAAADAEVDEQTRARAAAEAEADEAARDDYRRALQRDALLVVPDCALITGYGLSAGLDGQGVTIFFLPGRVEFLDAHGYPREQVPVASLFVVDADGPGAAVSGGGFVGGGTGVGGAAEGILMAAGLNALTRRRSVTTFIEIHAHRWHSVWVTAAATPAQLAPFLKPVQALIREQSSPGGLVDRLAQLEAALRRGLISNGEFADTKRRILTDL